MKKSLIILLIILSLTNCSNDDDVQTPAEFENVCVGDVTILNQQELDDFVSNNCTKVDGFLKISGVDDLSGLSYLKEVTGDFFIGYSDSTGLYDNPDLENINGIENLKQVGGELRVVYNYLIEEVNQLYNLEYVGDRFTIYGNSELTNCYDFEKLLSIGNRGLWIQDNNKLTTIDFPVLETIGKLNLTHGFSLENVNFPNLLSVDNEFRIYECYPLANLDGFSSLESLNDFIIISTGISNLNGFSNLRNVSGYFIIGYCDNLIDYCEISDVTFSDTNDINIDYNAYNPSINQLFSSIECSN